MHRLNSAPKVATKALATLRKSRGWLNINFSGWETKQLRALAECEEIPFRHFLERDLRSWRRESETRLGVTARSALALTHAERRLRAAKHRLVNRSISYPGKSPFN